jgi:dihydrofolate reductase
MKFTGIVCMSRNRVIGQGDKLPWPAQESDLSFFKEKTTNGHVIMGHKTWKGMGVPYLKNRALWVLTKTNNYGWLQMFNDKLQAQTNLVTDLGHLPETDNYWVAGGRSIYELFLPRLTEFYVTILDKEYEGDVIMPEFETKFSQNEIVKETERYKTYRYFNS